MNNDYNDDESAFAVGIGFFISLLVAIGSFSLTLIDNSFRDAVLAGFGAFCLTAVVCIIAHLLDQD